MTPEPTQLDPVLKLLAYGIALFAFLLIGVSKWSPNDGQTFQVLSGVLTALVGAFMTRIKPPDPAKAKPTTEESSAQ